MLSTIVHACTYTDYEGTDFEETTKYGYRVYDAHPLATLTFDFNIESTKLTLGDYHIEDYCHIEFQGMVPALYQVRLVPDKATGRPSRFVCGLDLTPEGKVWAGINGRPTFDTIQQAIDHINASKDVDEQFDLYIALEEYMPY